MSQQTVIRNQAELSLLERKKTKENSENEKQRKRIWPRRVPTDRDSESGRTQCSRQSEKKGENLGKSEKEKKKK